MEGEYHFDLMPIAPEGSEMLMHENLGRIRTFGYNTKEEWYIAPCIRHYRIFKGIMTYTGAEWMSNTVKLKHHAIAIPKLTPADIILEATRQLDDAIRQQPKRAPMDKLTSIELLRSVLLGEKQTPPPNIMQIQKARQAAMPPNPIAVAAPKPTFPIEDLITDLDAAYISDDEDGESTPPLPRSRHSRRVIAQKHQDEREKLHRIAFLAAQNQDLTIKDNIPTLGLGGANVHLQLSKWVYAQHITGAVIDHDTGGKIEYQDLVKKEKCRDTWINPLSNELGRLAQGIRDIKGTDTILFILKSAIPKDRLKEVTYGRIVVAYKPKKSEPHRSRLTEGGDRIVCLYDISTSTADLPTIKMLWKSVLSTPGA